MAVLATLKAAIRGPDHPGRDSMGGLIAVEVARREPRLVGHLFLCSMPLYKTAADDALSGPAVATGLSTVYGISWPTQLVPSNAPSL